MNTQHFEALQRRIGDLWLPLHEPPNLLFHYTSSIAMTEIIKTEVFWMTDVKYMNDSSELEYSTNIAREVIGAYPRQTIDEAQLEFINRISRTTPDIATHLLVCATCFSELHDSLEQWRGYGRGTEGYCLGIDPLFVGTNSGPQRLRKVIYDPIEQERILYEVLDAFVKACNPELYGIAASEQLYNEWMPSLIQIYSGILLEICSCIKHPAFGSEKEWRVVQVVQPGDNSDSVNFRCSGVNVIPFVSWSWKSVSDMSRARNLGKGYPVRVIAIGPSPTQRLNERSLTLFLKQRGVWGAVELVTSTIPYRSI